MNRKLVTGLATIIVLGGSAGAIAATQASATAAAGRPFIDDLAGRLHVSPAALQRALAGTIDDRIDAALAAGRISAARGAALRARVAEGPLGAAATGSAARAGALRTGLRAVERYLGIGPAALRTDLRSGRTLAQLADGTPGRSSAGLRSAVLAAEKARLDAAVASGAITSAQEHARLERLAARVDVLLSRTWIGEYGVLRPLRPYGGGPA